MIEIKRTKEKDEICARLCSGYSSPTEHSLMCPYTLDRWKVQGMTKRVDVILPSRKT